MFLDFKAKSGENKPKVQVGLAKKVKRMDWCSDGEKHLGKLALDLDILYLLETHTHRTNQECL